MIVLRNKIFSEDYLDELAKRPNGHELIKETAADHEAMVLNPNPENNVHLDGTKSKTVKLLKGSQEGNMAKTVPRNTRKFNAKAAGAIVAGTGVVATYLYRKNKKKNKEDKDDST